MMVLLVKVLFHRDLALRLTLLVWSGSWSIKGEEETIRRKGEKGFVGFISFPFFCLLCGESKVKVRGEKGVGLVGLELPVLVYFHYRQ